jgi:hypothetical protein
MISIVAKTLTKRERPVAIRVLKATMPITSPPMEPVSAC